MFQKRFDLVLDKDFDNSFREIVDIHLDNNDELFSGQVKRSNRFQFRVNYTDLNEEVLR